MEKRENFGISANNNSNNNNSVYIKVIAKVQTHIMQAIFQLVQLLSLIILQKGNE